jgi:hypothetical protein
MLTEGEHLYQVSQPVQMLSLHLYSMVCTRWIPGTNEGSHPVQMHVFPVVLRTEVVLRPSATCGLSGAQIVERWLEHYSTRCD